MTGMLQFTALLFLSAVPVGCSYRLICWRHAALAVNTAAMLVKLRNKLFAFAAFFDVVLHPGANLRLRCKESTGEPGQQFADKRGAALDFHFSLVHHAAVDFPIKVEQVTYLES